MIDPKKLRGIKVILERNGKQLSEEEIERLLESAESLSEKNFITGLKHIAERHYTEAIKWLQLSDCKDAPMIVAVLSFKLGDLFLYEEYASQASQIDCLAKFRLSLFLQTEKGFFPVSPSTVKNLFSVIS
ncbi:hypothetical protein [Persephonella sp.]